MDLDLLFCFHKGEQSGLDHSFSSMKDELLLCDDTLSPSPRKIIGDRGGPASMKENICQVSFSARSVYLKALSWTLFYIFQAMI